MPARSDAAPVLAAPVRTPIGKFGGRLARLTATDLGTAAAEACLERAGVPAAAVDQLVFGHARQTAEELPFDRQRLDPDGGAISLGHPVGSTGARILVTLLRGLADRGGRVGLATLCVSGGKGMAALIEQVTT